MASRTEFIRHRFDGGWNVAMGPSADLTADASGTAQIPFLLKAENCGFELNGAPHKFPGTEKLHTVSLGSPIRGIHDYWRMGTAGAPEQHRVIVHGTSIADDDGDGVWNGFYGTLASATTVPSFAQLDDSLIIFDDDIGGAVTPRSWTGAATALITKPVSATTLMFGETHKNRLFAAGDIANPSRLYWSDFLDFTNWTAVFPADGGFLDINLGDGDQITAIASHKGELIIFKGPNRGSIHRLVGTSSSDFTLSPVPFTTGVGAVWQNSLFRFRDDLGFVWSDGTVRSMNATDRYGDYAEVSLSKDIDPWIRDNVNTAALKTAWADTSTTASAVYIAVPTGASTVPNTVLYMDFRFPVPRWSHMTNVFPVQSLAEVIDPDDKNKRKMMFGGPDGFVRKHGRSERTVDANTAIPMVVDLPHLSYIDPFTMKSITTATMGVRSEGSNHSATMTIRSDEGWTRDYTVLQGGGDKLDVDFILDSSILGGSLYQERWIENTDGEFRTVQYGFSNAQQGQDLELHSFGVALQPNADSTEQ